MKQLVDTLTATPGAENDLLVHFKQKGWVDITAKATAEQLITKALNDIKCIVGRYRDFIDMLNEMAGMKEVASSIEGNITIACMKTILFP